MLRRRTTRREFVCDVALVGGGVCLASLSPGCRREKAAAAPEAPKPMVTRAGLRTFTVEEFATVEALVERILPTDQDAGARDAGCAEYIDCMLAVTPIRRQKEDFIAGLGSLMRQAQTRFAAPFPRVAPNQQDEMIRGFQTSKFSGENKFVAELLVLTLEGYFGDPSYGGNKDRVGWRLCGYDPPFPLSHSDDCSHG